MRRLTFSLMAAAAVLTVGGAASAQSAPAPQREMTRAAVEQRAERTFARLDANRDGKIDTADRAVRQKARFDRIDANRDGQLSYAEFTAMRGQRDHKRADATNEHGRRGQHFARRGGHRFAMRGFAGRGGMVRLADADKDGAITQAEFQAAALSRFDRLDGNHDGTVTRDEAKAARDNMRQRWQARRQDRAS
jgi:Ca2+-binding EF-hand superfamily protein